MTHSITITWAASAPPVSGYNIYRGTALGQESNTPLNTSLITATTYTDNTVFPGITYSYYVKSVLGIIESVGSLEVLSPSVPFEAVPPVYGMGASNSFLVLAASTVTVAGAGPTLISGDVGLSPGTSITGFPPALISGSFHVHDAYAASGITDLTTVYNQYKALTGGITIGGDIGNTTMVPGIYKVATSTGLGEGTLILDGGGNPNSVWVFQIGTTLITAASTNILLVGGAQAGNIFWIVGTSATLGATSNFAGTIIANASISVGASVYVDGRLGALTGAITFAGIATVQMFTANHTLVTPAVLPALAPPAPPAAPTGLIITNEV